MSYKHGKRIRDHEIEWVLQFMEQGQTVLEIGAGAGWQADAMNKHGLTVVAIDIPESLTT